MSDEYGSATPYRNITLDQLHESIGIPQFSGTASTDWFLVFNGLLIQGGLLVAQPAASTVSPFTAKFSQQVLGVFMTCSVGGCTYAVTATTLDTFTSIHTGAAQDMYWWAIGV